MNDGIATAASTPSTWITRKTIERMMPASARPSPVIVPPDRLHSLRPITENTRPSTPQTNEHTKPAIAMPDVRVAMTLAAGMSVAPTATAVPQVAQNDPSVAAPHFGQVMPVLYRSGGRTTTQALQSSGRNGIRPRQGWLARRDVA